VTPSLLRRFLIGLVVAAIAAGVFVGTAKLGNWLALRQVPVEELKKPDYPTGMRLSLEPAKKPFYLGSQVRRLRDFHFARKVGDGFETFIGQGLVTVLQSPERVETLETDADMVRIRIMTGKYSGEIYWIHREQLPAQRTPGPWSPVESGAAKHRS